MGWFGFALFLAFCGTCLAMNFRIGRQALRLGPAHAALCVTACLSLLYGVTTGFAAQNMSVAPTGYLVMSLPGLVLAIDWSLKRRARQVAALRLGRRTRVVHSFPPRQPSGPPIL